MISEGHGPTQHIRVFFQTYRIVSCKQRRG